MWGPRLQTALVVGGSAALAVFAGAEVARGGPESLSTPLLGLAALAGAIVLFSIPPEKLFLGWLFLAPLFQNSADATAIGRPLSFALYVAPPLVLLAHTLVHSGGQARARFVDALPALYAVYVTLSLAFATSLLQEDTFGSLKSLYLSTVVGAIAYYVVVFGPAREVRATRIARVVLAAAATQAVLALAEWATGWGLWGQSGWQLDEPPRTVATLVNPATLGTFLGAGIVVALAVLAWNGPVALRRLSWLTLLLCVPALLTTLTRAPVIATVIGALGVLLVSGRSRALGIGAAVTAVLAIVAIWPQLSSSELYESRIANRVNVQGRSDIEDISLRAAAKKPVFGWGYGQFEEAKVEAARGFTPRVQGSLETTSHNGFLTILVEFGALGLLFYLAPWVVIMIAGARAVRLGAVEPWFGAACLSALVVIAVAALANDFKVFSLLVALPWALLGLVRRDL